MTLLRHLSAALALMSGAVLIWLGGIGVHVSYSIPATAIRHDAGYRSIVDVSPIVPFGFTIRTDSSAAPNASELLLFENNRRLGPPHSLHKDILTAGGGRFSYWQGALLFSSGDNTDPRTNGRRYHVESIARLGYGALWVGIALALLSLLLERSPVARVCKAFACARATLWLLHNVAPSVIGSLAVVALIAAAGETYFRLTTPFSTTSWPSEFDPRVGFIFKPGAEVRWTNNLDFWTVQKANSLGFLDHEPPTNATARECRVALIGDSFVEAAQVPIREKVQSDLERMAAKERPEWRLSASAFGFSGTGQLNQLPFYDYFVREQHPNLVVLVFVSNDFANNSTLLEAIRNGWSPDHPPRVFARRNPSGNGYSIIPIDPNWQAHLLPSPPERGPCLSCDAYDDLKSRSLFFRWIAANLELVKPALAAPFQRSKPDEATRFRLHWLARQPAYSAAFQGWDGRLNMDAAFWEKDLAPVFREALALTGFALDEFKQRTERDDSRLLILATSEMSARAKTGDPGYGRRYFNRLKVLTDERQIPLLDQYSWIVARGIKPSALEFRHDGHWTPLAHRIAAEMLLRYLEANPQICSRNSGLPHKALSGNHTVEDR